MSGVSSRWRIPRWLGPAALVMLAWLPTPPGAQTVAAVQGTAWCSQRPGAAPLPDGGVEVAVGFGGEVQSVAAIAVRVDAPVRTVVLILEESDATGSETADLRVCRTDPGSIRGANPGAWEEPEIPVAVDEGFVAPPLQAVSPDTEASMPTATDVDRQTQVGSGNPEPVSADDLFATGPVPGAAGDARPWWRLVVLVPLSAAVGLGAALGRRRLIEGASTSTAVPA